MKPPPPGQAVAALRRGGWIALSVLGPVTIGYLLVFWLIMAPIPGDTITYLETGNRLNRGEPLYAPHDFGAGYARVATFSPPLIGVVFRPLAALPDGLGVLLWLSAMAALEVAGITLLYLRSPALTGIAAFLLAPAIGLTIVVGNVDALVLCGLVSVWLLLRGGRETAAGLLLGLLASLKLTPAAVLWWALLTGRRRAVAAALLAAGGLALITILGSEPLVYARFVEVTLTNYGGAMGSMSLGALGRSLGTGSAAALLPVTALIGGLTLAALVRGRPGLAWSIAIATMVLGSPVAAFHSPALLLAMLAPVAYPPLHRARTLPQAMAAGQFR